MNDQFFSLQPFSPTSTDLEIIGTISRRLHIVTLRYTLLGALSELTIPEPKSPARQSNLWKSTCFECFLSLKNSPKYWEFNFSPSGAWNIYRFTDYRQGIEVDKGLPALPFTVEQEADSLSLVVEINLDKIKILRPNQRLEMGLSAVIQSKSGELSHWALTHVGPKADFHQRASFTIKL